ncbi:MAG: hypothetical protein M5R40_04355 [Anaerolineae bacterium]|nr:hypothetical protein [Anaerolineae bacterium]
MIVDAPDVRDSHVNLRVAATWLDNPRQPVTGVALVQAPATVDTPTATA